MIRIFKRLTPRSFFIISSVILWFVYTLVTPPLQSPDEFNHFYRAYQISEGHFLPVKNGKRLGGFMPLGIIRFTESYRPSAGIIEYTTTRSEIINTFKIELDTGRQQFADFVNTSYYSPVSYIPHAFAIFILRQFSDSVGLLYYGGRLFTFITWMLFMLFVLKLLPIQCWLFTVLMLLPMHIYVVNSFSADTVSIILSFVFIALVLNTAFSEQQITNRRLLQFACVLVLLALAKVVYVGVIVLLLIIPSKNFKNTSHQIMSLLLLVIIVAFTCIAWSNTVMSFYMLYKDYDADFRDLGSGISICGNYQEQKQYILNNGFYFFTVIYNSLFRHPHTYLSGLIGYFGNSDVFLPNWIYVLSYPVIVLVASIEKKTIHLNFYQKIILFSAATTSFVLLLLSQHLIWDCVGEGIVDLVQGRYLIPLVPLIFLLFPSLSINRINIVAVIAVFVIFINAYSANVINQRYFVGNDYDRTEFYCDAEDDNGSGLFLTTEKNILLEGANSKTSLQHRSGISSLRLNPDSPFGFNHKLSNLKAGDLIEVEAWQKGEGARLVFSGGKAGCKDFYASPMYESYSENGWRRIKSVFIVDLKCEDMNGVFYVWSPSKGNVFIDDLRFTHKRLKP